MTKIAQCPKCGAALPPAATTCASCQADVSLWLARAGQVYGPYTLADLQRSQREGRLGRDDMVMIGSEGCWEPLAGFLQLLASPAAPVPMPPPTAPVPSMAPRPRRGGDPTLAIVLVVAAFILLSIVAVLAAILFPVFARAREKARQDSCLSNTKQISLALLMYAQDYDERLPQHPLVARPERLEDAPADANSHNLGSYCVPGNWRLLILPYTRNEAIFLCPASSSYYSYQFNNKLHGVQLRKFSRPADTLCIYEFGALDGSAPGPHNDGYNAGYVDGHCKWLHESNARQARTTP